MRRELLTLLLVATAIASTQAAQCAYTTYTSCPWYKFWLWGKTCSRTAYRYCVHGGWSSWTQQSRTSCSKLCGGGTYVSTQTRSCTNPYPSGGGNSCSGVSSKRITVSCNTQRCPIHGGWSDWGVWEDTTQCTVTCGGGEKQQSRDRSCTNPAPQYGGRACVGGNSEGRTVGCNTQECPIDGGWSDWGDWEDTNQCTVTCGGGEKQQSRDRSCTNPAPQYGGRACAGVNTEQRTVVCSTQECPIDGGWSDWGDWEDITQCTVTCGGGEKNQSRDRSCTNPAPQYGGRACAGANTERRTVDCSTQECPIDGGWSDWGNWEDITQCTVTCGGGKKNQSRDRSCTNPAPQYGGRACAGENTEQKVIACNTQECPIDGGWSDWGDWENITQCTMTCGGGEKNQSRDRSCTNPTPQYGGRACAGENTEQKIIACNTQECPIDGGWSDWSDWEDTSKCTVLCGGGEKNQSRDRSCTNPQPQYGGLDCDGENTQDRSIACNTDECGSLCPEGENTFITDADDNYYYHCQQGNNNTVLTKAVLRQCAEGTTWDQGIKSCVHETEDTPTTPAPAPVPAPSCTESTSRADPDDCTFYLQCIGGSEIRRLCAAGTKFDNSLGLCRVASLVTC